MRRLALASILLVTGCGLPLTDGARSAGDVPDEQSRPAGTKVLPPGPQPGATAQELVQGFLRAQVSPDDDHRVARQFLTPQAQEQWDDDAFVIVYSNGSQTVRAVPDSPGRVELSLQPTAIIEADGSYRPAPPDRLAPAEAFEVERVAGGELRLSEVPPGLRLRAADVGRSFAPDAVYFLGRSTVEDATARLVPDRVFLPVTVGPAKALVAALLGGPSTPLEDAVESAAPEDTTAQVEVSDGRLVTVDLSRQVLELAPRDRQRLSAQLVWTLEDYRAVRLLVEGEPFEVPATGEVQSVDDWDEYDPAGVAEDAPLYYVADGRLRSLDRELRSGEASSGAVSVDEAAVDPVGGRLGVLTVTDGLDDVRIGSLQGSLGQPVFQRPDLGSLSWGSGDRGLWVLERGPRPQLWVLPSGGPPLPVAVPSPPGAGRLTKIEVSRDGARIALVFGEGTARRLHVGHIEPTEAGGVVVDGVVSVAPDLEDVTDVAWESGTSLVVLASTPPATGLLVLQVAVDGSTAAPLPVSQGVKGVPRSIAAAPSRPLVLSSAAEGELPELYRDDGTLFSRQAGGSAPFYPG